MSDTNYPQLRAALEKYVIPGREDDLVLRYQQYGEETAEFAGLKDELDAAVRDSGGAAAMFQELTGYDGDPSEVRDGMIALSDRLRGVGAYDVQNASKVEGAELFAKSGGVPLQFGGRPVLFRGKPLPLWTMLALSAAVVFVGYFLTYVPWPSWLTVVPKIFFLFGLAGLVFSAAAITQLRSEARDPAKAARRAKAIEDAQRKHEEKSAGRSNWFRRNLTF